MTLLAAIMVGLMNVVVSGKRLILHSRSRMGGGELGKVFVDFFPSFVSANDWQGPPYNDYATTNPLSTRACPSCNHPGGHAEFGADPANPHTLPGGVGYTSTYQVTNVPGFPNYPMRKVRLNINWTSPQPF